MPRRRLDSDIIELPMSVLTEPVAWPENSQTPTQFKDFIATRAPPDQARSLSVEPRPDLDPVPSASDLGIPELKRVVNWRLTNGNHEQLLRGVTPSGLIKEVENETAAGLGWIRAVKTEIGLMENLALTNRLRLVHKP